MNNQLVTIIEQRFKLNETLSYNERNQTPFIDSSCPDFDIAKQCEILCVDTLTNCIAECDNDISCAAECFGQEIDCIDRCPCHVMCPEGSNCFIIKKKYN